MTTSTYKRKFRIELVQHVMMPFCIVTFISLLPISLDAASLSGVTLPDKIMIANKTLHLNGIAVRKVPLLKIRIFVAGLYLESKSRNAHEILDSSQTKKIHVHFLKSISKHKIASVWADELSSRCSSPCPYTSGDINKLGEQMEDINRGDSLEFIFDRDGLEVIVKGRKKERINHLALGSGLLAIWIGPKPIDLEVKKELLTDPETSSTKK